MQAEQDERVKILMEGMRGRSLNQNDFADDGVSIQVLQAFMKSLQTA